MILLISCSRTVRLVLSFLQSWLLRVPLAARLRPVTLRRVAFGILVLLGMLGIVLLAIVVPLLGTILRAPSIVVGAAVAGKKKPPVAGMIGVKPAGLTSGNSSSFCTSPVRRNRGTLTKGCACSPVNNRGTGGRLLFLGSAGASMNSTSSSSAVFYRWNSRKGRPAFQGI